MSEKKYIVMDLEFNQSTTRFRSEKNGILLSNEIIEIGAVKLNEKLEQVDTFKSFIKPTAYPKINDMVHKLTSITTEMVWEGGDFDDVIKSFLDWCGEDYVFVTWSDNDIFALEDNMLYHGMEIDSLPECYDIQAMFDDQISMNERSMALNYAIWKLGIKVSGGELHEALYDAMNTSEVFKRLDISDGLGDYEV